jgi:hypothetical protein
MPLQKSSQKSSSPSTKNKSPNEVEYKCKHTNDLNIEALGTSQKDGNFLGSPEEPNTSS